MNHQSTVGTRKDGLEIVGADLHDNTRRFDRLSDRGCSRCTVAHSHTPREIESPAVHMMTCDILLYAKRAQLRAAIVCAFFLYSRDFYIPPNVL